MEFERFQTMSVFTIKDELNAIAKKQDAKKLSLLASHIVKLYGNLYHKINFMQNLRSKTDYIYNILNTEEIIRIAQWVTDIREELKNNLVKKQEKEIYNRQMYAYMHDIFGADVIEMFDMKYNPQNVLNKEKDIVQMEKKES